MSPNQAAGASHTHTHTNIINARWLRFTQWWKKNIRESLHHSLSTMFIYYKSYLCKSIWLHHKCWWKMDIVYVAKCHLFSARTHFQTFPCCGDCTENEWPRACPQKHGSSGQRASFSSLFYCFCQGVFFLCCLLHKMNGSSWKHHSRCYKLCVKVGNRNIPEFLFSFLFVKSESKIVLKRYDWTFSFEVDWRSKILHEFTFLLSSLI